MQIFYPIFSDDACMSRTTSQPCYKINDRGTCLTSTDNRNVEFHGVQLFGSNCHWCPDGPCTSHNANRCEPEPFLKSKGVKGYETCMQGKIKVSKRVYIILAPFLTYLRSMPAISYENTIF